MLQIDDWIESLDENFTFSKSSLTLSLHTLIMCCFDISSVPDLKAACFL